MEKRRNRPPKYDREDMKTTLRAMKRVAEIKQKRDADFHKARYNLQHSILSLCKAFFAVGSLSSFLFAIVSISNIWS
tara:strand:- start:545 stop:775 length:231 start_codon:yes stop_codon:yes gene_type:complete